MPRKNVGLLKSFISDSFLEVNYSDLKVISAGVPHGSVLGPVLYLLYISDMSELEHNAIVTFADDNNMKAVGEDHKKLDCTKLWPITLNETKYVHISFTNKKKPI